MPPSLESPALWTLTQGKVMVWVLVLTRLTGLLAVLPGLGQERLPLQVRALLAILMTTVVAPTLPANVRLAGSAVDLGVSMTLELGTGLLMGLMVAWILEAVGFGGQLMDIQMGFSFVQFLDPASGQTTSVTGAILARLCLLFIFVSGLHHTMILALVESFRIVPLGEGPPLHPQDLVAAVGLLLVKGLQLAAPVLLVLFFVDVLEGISAKFMPQLQLIQLSFPIKITVGLAVFALAIREFGTWVMPLLEWAPRQALRLLH